MQVTSTEIIYESEIIYPETNPAFLSLIFGHIWKIDVSCRLPNHGTINIQLHPEETHSPMPFSAPTTFPVTTHHYLTASVNGVPLQFHFYSDPGFIHEINGNPIHAYFGEEVYVKVTHNSVDNELKMILDTCYTKPGSGNGPIFYLIENG